MTWYKSFYKTKRRQLGCLRFVFGVSDLRLRYCSNSFCNASSLRFSE